MATVIIDDDDDDDDDDYSSALELPVTGGWMQPTPEMRSWDGDRLVGRFVKFGDLSEYPWALLKTPYCGRVIEFEKSRFGPSTHVIELLHDADIEPTIYAVKLRRKGNGKTPWQIWATEQELAPTAESDPERVLPEPEAETVTERVADEKSKICYICSDEFTLWQRRKHCETCRRSVCGAHSDRRPTKFWEGKILPNFCDARANVAAGFDFAYQRTCDRCFEARLRSAVGWPDKEGDQARARPHRDVARASMERTIVFTAADFPDEPMADVEMVAGFATLVAIVAERQAAAEAVGIETAQQAILRIAREEEAERTLIPVWQAGLQRDAAVKFGGRVGRLIDRTGEGAGPSWPPSSSGFVKMRFDDTGEDSGLITATDLCPPTVLAASTNAAAIRPCTHSFALECADYHFGRPGGPWRCPACGDPLVDAGIVAQWEGWQREARDQ
eukprot:SAG31_NODE_3225_length_4519_cov_2.363122_1_plen_443_part_10